MRTHCTVCEWLEYSDATESRLKLAPGFIQDRWVWLYFQKHFKTLPVYWASFFFTWLNNVILFLLFVFGRSFAKRAPFMVGPDSRLTWIKLFNVRYKSTAAIPTRCKKLGRLWIGYVLWFVATHFKSFNNSSSDLPCYVFIIIWLWEYFLVPVL